MKKVLLFMMLVPLFGITIVLHNNQSKGFIVEAQSQTICDARDETIAALYAYTSFDDGIRQLTANLNNVSREEIDIDDDFIEFSRMNYFCSVGADGSRNIPYCSRNEGFFCILNGTDLIAVPEADVGPDDIDACKTYLSSTTFGSNPLNSGTEFMATFFTNKNDSYALTDDDGNFVLDDNNFPRFAVADGFVGSSQILFWNIAITNLDRGDALIDLLIAAMTEDDPQRRDLLFAESLKELFACKENQDGLDVFTQFEGDFIDYGIGEVIFEQECDGVTPTCSITDAPQVSYDPDSESYGFDVRMETNCVYTANDAFIEVNGSRVLDIDTRALEGNNGLRVTFSGTSADTDGVFNFNENESKVDDEEFNVVVDGAAICNRTSANEVLDLPEIPEEEEDEEGEEAQSTNQTNNLENCNNDPTCEQCVGQGGIWIAIGCVDPSPVGILTRIVQTGIGVMGGVALVQLIYAGIMYQSGVQERIAKARQSVMSTLIGLAVLVFSILILQVIGVNVLDITSAGFL